ncbi:gliding motility-associated C-terminal domain-containing protein [Parapedobacter lycopersici]|uniref:T9SS type B sorting domain-containing protein n=1 Tax=Parapedobacter lycopersici TaxID=1864939 RepID=UPI00334291FC
MFRWLRHIAATVVALVVLHSAWAQEQAVHIAQGSSVTFRADAANALSYLWFRDGEPLNGYHEQRITVNEPGIYTVMALGNECNSDLSDPVQVIVDQTGPPVTVDMQIRNVPDRPMVLVDGVFTHQLFIVNNGTGTATDVQVIATFAPNVRYENVVDMHAGTVVYNAAMRELTWSPGNIAPGQSESLIIGVRAESEGLASQLAVVASSEEDSRPADNQSIGSVEVVALKIPNTFTPNGDGVNDYFEIRGLELFPAHQLTIFNRWGNEIYRSNNYRNDWNGAGLGEGTYYYAFELRLHTGHVQVFKGFITLIRNTNN